MTRTMADEPNYTQITKQSTTLTSFLWRVAAVLLCVALMGAWLIWPREEVDLVTYGPDGAVAFRRRIHYFIPADTDDFIYLAKSLDDRSTWVRISPALGGPWVDGSIRWIAPGHLYISARRKSGWPIRIGDYKISWR